jgi:hypothetical protein
MSDDRRQDLFEGMTDQQVEQIARHYWLDEQEELLDDDDGYPVYDDRYDWNP